jgi:hypothetical protein
MLEINNINEQIQPVHDFHTAKNDRKCIWTKAGKQGWVVACLANSRP